MDKREFASIAMALRTYYPRENLLPNDQAAALWFEQLQDLDYKVAEAALKKWVATNKWSPSIAELREAATEVRNGKTPDWGEAWESVRRAIRRFGSYNPKEAMDSLDDLTREAVKRIGFVDLCMSENPTAERANFRMVYETLARRRKEDAQIPAPLLQLINSIQNNNRLEG